MRLPDDACRNDDLAAAMRLLPPGGRSRNLDFLTDLASNLLAGVGGPVSIQVSLLSDAQYVPSGTGLPDGVIGATSDLSSSLCTVTAGGRAPLIVVDARSDPRVSHLPPVTSGLVGAYLGVPLLSGGAVAGALCAFHPEPRRWTDGEELILRDLARTVITQLELDAVTDEMVAKDLRWEMARIAAGIGSFDWHLTSGRLDWDQGMLELFGYEPAEFVPHIDTGFERVHPADRPAVDAAVEAAIAACGEYFAAVPHTRAGRARPFFCSVWNRRCPATSGEPISTAATPFCSTPTG